MCHSVNHWGYGALVDIYVCGFDFGVFKITFISFNEYPLTASSVDTQY